MTDPDVGAGGTDDQRSAVHAGVRPLASSDADAVLAAFSSAGMDRQGSVTDLQSAADWVQQALQPGRRVFAVVVGNELVGSVSITGIDIENRTGWFSYWMHDDWRGKGLTGRAAATVATWALTDAGLERLELGHRANNPASGAVALTAGFVHEGTERAKFLIDGTRHDVLTYGRLHTDPHPITPALPLAT